MCQSHTGQKRNDTPEHDLVLSEQPFRANETAENSQEDDDEGESGAPPADKKRSMVCLSSPARWRRIAQAALHEIEELC